LRPARDFLSSLKGITAPQEPPPPSRENLPILKPGTGHNLPIRSSTPWNSTRGTVSSANWNTSRRAWPGPPSTARGAPCQMPCRPPGPSLCRTACSTSFLLMLGVATAPRYSIGSIRAQRVGRHWEAMSYDCARGIQPRAGDGFGWVRSRRRGAGSRPAAVQRPVRPLRQVHQHNRFTSRLGLLGAEFLRVLFVSGPWVCLKCPLRPGARADVRPPLLPEVMISVVQERET